MPNKLVNLRIVYSPNIVFNYPSNCRWIQRCVIKILPLLSIHGWSGPTFCLVVVTKTCGKSYLVLKQILAPLSPGSWKLCPDPMRRAGNYPLKRKLRDKLHTIFTIEAETNFTILTDWGDVSGVLPLILQYSFFFKTRRFQRGSKWKQWTYNNEF